MPHVDALDPDRLLVPQLAYTDYRFLGRIPTTDTLTRSEARAIARERFHPDARVFRTARFYVAYRIL